MQKIVRFTNGLTENEIKVLNASRSTNFGDCMKYPQWSFAVCETAGMEEKSYRGVVSSLVKKSLVFVEDHSYNGKGKFRDMVLGITKQGKKLFNEKEMQSMKEFDELESMEMDQVTIEETSYEPRADVPEDPGVAIDDEDKCDSSRDELPDNVLPDSSTKNSVPFKIEDIIKTNSRGKVSNFQMIPAITNAIHEGSLEKLLLLKQYYPSVFAGSLRYLRKPYREYIAENMK